MRLLWLKVYSWSLFWHCPLQSWSCAREISFWTLKWYYPACWYGFTWGPKWFLVIFETFSKTTIAGIQKDGIATLFNSTNPSHPLVCCQRPGQRTRECWRDPGPMSTSHTVSTSFPQHWKPMKMQTAYSVVWGDEVRAWKLICPLGPGRESSRREKPRESIKENSQYLTRATCYLANTWIHGCQIP